MKAQVKMILSAAIALSVSSAAFGAGMRSVGEVKSRIEDVMKNRSSDARIGLTGKTPAEINTEIAKEISAISKTANQNEIASVLGKKSISAPEANGKTKSVDLTDLARIILASKQASKEVREANRNQGDAEAQKIVDALDQASDVSAQFLALVGRSANGFKTSNETTQAFNKQVSLISEILSGKMSVAEIQSHTDFMKDIVAATSGNTVKIEAAFDAALKQKYGNQAEAKKKEIIDCI
ncbi:MAG: hypothetical protein COT73_03585 [Bdellovibrio sp. CG10_big_fil_rev_8_21_14_0_10_47_8]|nr:MAG: hypothetical protein COT73_03585 [Bdellovibrio sp. CG10_big_fil_rev_8_21_14_0_10_47_8]